MQALVTGAAVAAAAKKAVIAAAALTATLSAPGRAGAQYSRPRGNQ